MSTNLSPKFSAYLGKYKTMDPSQMQMLLTCFGMWMNIQQQKIQVSLLQKKLNDILVVYMKRRKCHLMQMVDYNIKKLKQMIEYTHSPQQFYELFHVSLPAFLRMRDILYKQDLEPSGWIPEIELLLFLFWLSSGSSFRKTSSFCGISVPSLNKIFQDIFNKFLANLSNVIQFQKTDTEYLCAGFQKLTSCHIFGLVMGCLDTYHVPINLKSKDKHYINNTQNTSIQVQVVCDYNGAFIDIAIGFPGGMLKSHVLQCTPLYLEALMPAKGFVLLSGSGFPCLQQPICLIPPFSNADDPVKERFNSCQQKVHSVIEKSIGQMHERWNKLFSKPLILSLPLVTKVVIACSMIHNICIEMEDIWPKEAFVDFNVNEEDTNIYEGQISGENTQKQMAVSLLSEHEMQKIMNDYSVYEI